MSAIASGAGGVFSEKLLKAKGTGQQKSNGRELLLRQAPQVQARFRRRMEEGYPPRERRIHSHSPARRAGQTGAHATGTRARDARRRRQPVRGVGAPRSRRRINMRVAR